MDAITQAQTAATNGVGEVWSLIGGFIVLIVLIAVLFAFALRAGRGLFVSLIISLYAGYALYLVFPYTSIILSVGAGSALMLFAAKTALYAVSCFIPFVIIRRAAGYDYYAENKLILLLLCFLTSSFIIAIAYHTLGVKAVYAFSPSLDALFAPAKYFFWWFIAPIAGLLFLFR